MNSSQIEHSVLYKWSSCDSKLRAPDVKSRLDIRKIHVYDFDNTLFNSPAPNPSLLSSYLINILTDPHKLSNGGWWSEPRFLRELIREWTVNKASATDLKKLDQIDAAYWNRDIVELSRISREEPGVVSILMTGRKEQYFKEVIGGILDQPVFGADKLQFNAVFLKKPGYHTTMAYKTACLTDLLEHYDRCEEITIYDDRIRQLRGFQQFLNEFVEAVRPSLLYNLIYVSGIVKYLDPAKERGIITCIFEEHNEAVSDHVKRGIHSPTFTGGKMDVREKRLGAAYILTPLARKHVVQFVVDRCSHLIENHDISHLMFSPRTIPCTGHGAITSRRIATKILLGLSDDPPDELIDKTMELMNDGKESSRIKFRVVGFGFAKSHGIYALKVIPIPSSRFIFSEFPDLLLVVASIENTDYDTVEICESSLYSWSELEESITIDTDFGYDFILSAVPHKRAKKRKQ
ncbi:LAMI_0G07338g1_1 [Lachancea mirantina]|uniref:LAMI_0G07338g1_1 n=1 Tax=Lachancea mirantina TaxID=1230905 RepID=A0A1G4K9I3_9SACH|nr:LAMI_0G07338g1_1 [Lachancea mirantina]